MRHLVHPAGPPAPQAGHLEHPRTASWGSGVQGPARGSGGPARGPGWPARFFFFFFFKIVGHPKQMIETLTPLPY